ncbi:MAG TPA: alanine--tRNA ligase-related protein, partial [Verrucomicrobiae bacterium]|nr:alanine--tRNA ligase-related protein [Verrucomicrobiae bacterium]
CTEIYIDRTPDKTGGKSVNGDDPRVMEIWNLVFIQYKRGASGKLTPLPQKHVDTGMGFERICQVLQEKQDNYAIDLWTPLFDRMRELSGCKYAGKFPPTNAPDPKLEAADEQLRHDIAFRVVADHARCLTFALTDGAVPSNEGRGYVLRRILRRAVRFGRQQLGLAEPFLHKLVPVVVESMGAAFPELRKNPGHVTDVIRDEEISFGKTLDRGIEIFATSEEESWVSFVNRASESWDAALKAATTAETLAWEPNTAQDVLGKLMASSSADQLDKLLAPSLAGQKLFEQMERDQRALRDFLKPIPTIQKMTVQFEQEQAAIEKMFEPTKAMQKIAEQVKRAQLALETLLGPASTLRQLTDQLKGQQELLKNLIQPSLAEKQMAEQLRLDQEAAKKLSDTFEAAQRMAERMREFEELVPTIPAETAFKLHDTYGFPIDLTRIMAEERGVAVDIVGYEKLMEEAREMARAGGKSAKSGLADPPPDAMAQLFREVKPAEDRAKFSHEPIMARVMAIWNGDDLGLSPSSVFEDEELAVILDKTNFFAEMGGQVGDSGTITSAAGAFDVQSTRGVGGYVLHIGRLRSGKIAVGDNVEAKVSRVRSKTEKNHTGTHLANWALRETLGEGVQQKGSLVDPDKLRFDFSHGKAMSDEEITRVEELVNEAIARKLPVFAQEAKQEEALKINGLRAVFGEKYPPMVRVVSIGAPVDQLIADPKNSKWREFSVEFCGGTHLANSNEVGRFAILAEESVSKGIRRIVAVTDDDASDALVASENIDVILSDAVKDEEIGQTLQQLQEALQFRVVPLLAKRKGQKAIAELQARQRVLEKSARAQTAGSGVDAVKA